MKITHTILTFLFCITTIIAANAQTATNCGDNKIVNKMEKSNLAIVIYSNDTETVWNALRLANYALTQKDTVKIFLLGKGFGSPKPVIRKV